MLERSLPFVLTRITVIVNTFLWFQAARGRNEHYKPGLDASTTKSPQKRGRMWYNIYSLIIH